MAWAIGVGRRYDCGGYCDRRGVAGSSPARAGREQVWAAGEAPLLEQGQEMGRFFLGSTVVLVTEASDLAWANAAGDTVTVRSALA